MKITLVSGEVNLRLFTPSNCTGYRAAKIEFNAEDIRRMSHLAKHDPITFEKCMLQLQARFPNNIQPYDAELVETTFHELPLPTGIKVFHSESSVEVRDSNDAVRIKVGDLDALKKIADSGINDGKIVPTPTDLNSPVKSDGLSDEDYKQMIDKHRADNAAEYAEGFTLEGMGKFAFVEDGDGKIMLCEKCKQIGPKTGNDYGEVWVSISLITRKMQEENFQSYIVTNTTHFMTS